MTMYDLTSIGRVFFAVALIGLAVEHYMFGEFVVGRAPKLSNLTWAYLSGAVFILAGIMVLAGKKGRIAAIFIGILIFVWAFLRHIPILAADSLLAPTWTAAGKALTLFGGALAIAGTFPKVATDSDSILIRFVNQTGGFVLLGRICLGIFLVMTGIQHFLYTPFVASLIPTWFPGNAVFWTYFGGVALLAGGVGLFVPQTARLAALLSGLMVFSWFWIIHIPRTLTSVSDGIAVFEALGVSGIAFTIAGSLYKQPGESPVEEDQEIE